MVVLVKEFDTAKLKLVELICSGGDDWASKDGKYTATYPGQEFVTGGTVLVRVPKK